MGKFKDLIDIKKLGLFKDQLDAIFATKVDKVQGKGLSTEDYTTAEKTKLANLDSEDVAYTYTPGTSHDAGTVGINLDVLNYNSEWIEEQVKGDDLLYKFADFPESYGEVSSRVLLSWVHWPWMGNNVNAGKNVATITGGGSYAQIVPLWWADDIFGANEGGTSDPGFPAILDAGVHYPVKFSVISGGGVSLIVSKNGTDHEYTGDTEFYLSAGDTLGIGLKVAAGGNVDCTIAVSMPDPKSNADLDEDIHGITVAMDGKVDKVNGKGLSTEDYTTAEKTKLGNLQSTDVAYTYNPQIIHSPDTVGNSLDTLNSDMTNIKAIKGNLLPKFATFPTDAGSNVAISWNAAKTVATVTITNGDGTTYADLWESGIPDILELGRTYKIQFESSDQNVVQLYIKKDNYGETKTNGTFDFSVGSGLSSLQLALKVNASGSYAPITVKIALIDTKTIADLDEDIQGKLDINQGSGNAGKAMVVGSDGILVPANATVELDSTLTQQGKAADAKAAGDKIAGLTAEMTLAQYNNLSQAQKMDGTIRFITDVSVLPSAEGVGF